MSSLAKEVLIKSCIICDPTLFMRSLIMPNVKVYFSNKMRFYKYFKSILNDAKRKRGKRKLYLKIEKPYEINFKGGENYCFYDSHKKAPLIIIEVKESNNILNLDIHPF